MGRERYINITGQRADISQRLAERVDDWDAGGGTVNGRQMVRIAYAEAQGASRRTSP